MRLAWPVCSHYTTAGAVMARRRIAWVHPRSMSAFTPGFSSSKLFEHLLDGSLLMTRKRVRTPEMEAYSRIGMELGQHFHEIISTLLLSMPIPDNLSQMEQGVRQAMLKLGNTLLSDWLALQNNQYPAQTVPCSCGMQAPYREMREGVLFTALGRVTYRRAYYLYDACHEGHYPLDERLGLRPGEISVDLERLTGFTGTHLPFGLSIAAPCLPRVVRVRN
jgi:hypothetical protein